ncbi:MAG: S41 family peptidase [Chthoniobacterales bacterium]
MLRLVLLLFLIGAAATLNAQTPAASATPTPTPSPTSRSLIDSLSTGDVQKAIDLLKTNYINPDALNDAEIDRSKLEGLLTRLGRGAALTSTAEANAPAAGFYSDVLSGRVAYLRLGDMTRPNLDALDKALSGDGAKKIDAAVIDLRASTSSNDFDTAAEFAKRFCPKGKTLFTLHKVAARQDRTFTSDREPSFGGLLIVLADSETSGAAEAVVAVLHANAKALVVGAPTAGRAVEYSDFKLSNATILRVAIGEAVLPGGARIFPDGVKPDIAVDMPLNEKRDVFQQSRDKGMAQFVFEAERPHMNEAALMAGRNPEIDAAEGRRGRGNEKPPLRDPVVQRALDVVTSIGVYRSR